MNPNTNFHNIREDFARGQGIDLKKVEVIHDTLYDWQTYVAAGQTQLSFFTEPRNSGTSIFDATQKKTLEDTNLVAQGQMTRGEAFLAKYVALRFVPGVDPVQETVAAAAAAVATNPAANDAAAFWENGYLDFRLANKPEVQLGPLAQFPPPQRFDLHVGGAVSVNQAAAADAAYQIEGTYLVPVGRLFELHPPGLTLEYGINFDFTLNWSKAVALPSGSAGRVQALLIGVRMRASQ